MKSRQQLPGIASFPESDIRKRFTSWWNAETERLKNDPFAPKEKGTLYDVVPDIDSLSVVESLVIAEAILNCKVPAKIIRSGGYSSANEMIEHLMPELRKLYEIALPK
jgi:hypothetical protein